jgi:hypothetical protein
MPTYEYKNTNTAADLLRYEKYTDPTDPTGKEKLSRSMNGLQEWLVDTNDGVTFYIKFDKNFSKKHFVTEPKKTTYSTPNSLDTKIAKLLTNRKGSQTCTCSHTQKYHEAGTNRRSVPCKECKRNATSCSHFGTPYVDRRTSQNKPDPDPLGGQATGKNTCIILKKGRLFRVKRPPTRLNKGADSPMCP